MAKANNEKMYIPNNNGNPTDDNGVVLPVWEYNNFELSKFIDNCEENGVTFIATESGAPDFSVLEMDKRITLITCCLLYTSPSPRDRTRSRMPSSA